METNYDNPNKLINDEPEYPQEKRKKVITWKMVYHQPLLTNCTLL